MSHHESHETCETHGIDRSRNSRRPRLRAIVRLDARALGTGRHAEPLQRWLARKIGVSPGYLSMLIGEDGPLGSIPTADAEGARSPRTRRAVHRPEGVSMTKYEPIRTTTDRLERTRHTRPPRSLLERGAARRLRTPCRDAQGGHRSYLDRLRTGARSRPQTGAQMAQGHRAQRRSHARPLPARELDRRRLRHSRRQRTPDGALEGLESCPVSDITIRGSSPPSPATFRGALSDSWRLPDCRERTGPPVGKSVRHRQAVDGRVRPFRSIS